MNDKKQDPNLQSPQEANTTKHINFLETEQVDSTNTNDGTNKDSAEDSPTKKEWEELRNENKDEQTSKE